jgi:tetratricopeptide (TPR) repeat protein
MSKYLTFLPILLLTLGTISPIAIAEQQQGTRIDRSTAPNPKYTGIVKQVDDIAQQITVRIEDKEGNGSGVIIAKEGNTYSVVTAAHVVKEREGYSIVTPTQERIVLKAEQVTILNKDLDIALVKFTSSQNYRTAELANYQFKDAEWVFISGFPGQDIKHRRSLSIGTLFTLTLAEFVAKDKFSLSSGNNLIYTNLSLPGMSGGAVLDREGRLIGINTAAENEIIINKNDNYQQEQINFGYALGISIPTILGAFSRGEISTAQLKIVTSIPSQIADSDRDIIRENLLSTISPPNQSSTAKEWLDYGNLLWRSFQFDRAIIAFDRAISILEKGKTSLDRDRIKIAYFGIGLALLYSENPKGAVLAFRAASTIDSQFLQAWRYQGMSFDLLGEYSEALNSYQKAIDLVSDNFSLYFEQGDILESLKRYPEAINSYDQAIKLKPQHPEAYNNRGLTYINLKQYPQALSDLNQAIKLNPQLAEAYTNRGLTYINLKQYSQALSDLNQAIKLNPQSAENYTSRGLTYINLKQYSQALFDLNQAIKLNPQLAEAYTNRGLTYINLKQYSQALSDLNQAIKLNPQSAEAYNNRGLTYNHLKQYIQAISDSNQAIKLSPQFAEAYVNRGIAYYRLKQYGKVKGDIKKAAELFQQQDNQPGYQTMMELLQQLSPLLK